MRTEEKIRGERQMVEEAPRLATQHPQLSCYAAEERKQALLMQGFQIPRHARFCRDSSGPEESRRGIQAEGSIR